jgi:hypothetical protein
MPTSRKNLPVSSSKGDRPESFVRRESTRASSVHIARKDGRMLKRMTLYLPSDLAKRLAVYCAEHEIDMSTIVTESVRRYLPE